MKYEFKGSSGKWQTNKTQEMVLDEHGRCIAEVYCPSELYPEMQDNCKLLAAAPDLLQACTASVANVYDKDNKHAGYRVIGLNNEPLSEVLGIDSALDFIEKLKQSAIEKGLTTPVKGE